MNHEQNARPAKGAGKITNVRYYTEDGQQVQEAVSTLERMSPEMAVYGRSISIEQLNRMTDTRDILVQMNGNVAEIRTFTKVLPEMSAKLDRIARNTDNL